MSGVTLRQRKRIDYSKMVNFENVTSPASSDEEYVSNDDTKDTDSEKELFSKKKPKLVASKVDPVSALMTNEMTEEEATNEYRMARQQNMKDRLMVLQTIDFEDDIKQLNQSQTLVKVTPVRKSTPKIKPKSKPDHTAFKRRSARLLKRSLESKGDEVENEKPFEDVETSVNEVEEEIADNLKLFETEEDREFYERLKKITIPYDSVDDFTTCCYEKFKDTIKSCFMYEEPSRVIASRISALDFHRSETKLLIIVGDKTGNVALADLNDKSQTQMKCHTRSTHCVSFGKQDGTKFFSTSLDGTVRQGDVNSNYMNIIYNNPDDHTTWHEERNHCLLIAEGKGRVQVVDLRVPTNSSHSTFSFSTRSVRTVQTHPLNEHYFLTSSGSACFGIWDDRNMSPQNPQPIIMQKFSKALSSAFFSYDGNRVLTTGVDDTVRVYDCANSTAKEICCVPHNNHNGRFLSVFKARWQPQRDDCFYVGSLLMPRRIQVYNGTNGNSIHNLTSDAMNTISPVLTIHPTKPIIVGGNASGKVHIFSPFKNLNDE